MPLAHLVALILTGWLVAASFEPAWARSRGPKRTAIDQIIIHATGGPSCQSGRVVFSDPGTVERIRAFFARSGAVSIHYIVGRDGEVAKGVPEDEIAFHTNGFNDRSIGIELINRGDGTDSFSEVQLAALAKLVEDIRRRHAIRLDNVVGHEDVDRSTFQCGGRLVRRKQDPGRAFPWSQFRFDVLLAGAPAERTERPAKRPS